MGHCAETPSIRRLGSFPAECDLDPGQLHFERRPFAEKSVEQRDQAPVGEGVEIEFPLAPAIDEPVVSQLSEVVADGGLGLAEEFADGRDVHFPAVLQQQQDP